MTAEMLRSDEPCAMARTLMPALPSAPKNVAATPAVCAMSSPTAARMLHEATRSTRWMCPSRISGSKARRDVVRASSACASGTAKQMECSELACEMSTTLTPTSRSAPKSRCATPGTPIIPVPSTLTRAMPSMVENPLTALAARTVAAVDARAGVRGVERVADPDGDPARDGGLHGARVKDLRAE